MRYLLHLTILIISSQLVHSQTEKHLTAVLVCNDFAIHGIEVANLDSKHTTISDGSGSFSIMAKVGDQLMFISENYEYKTITLKEADFQNSNFIIKLIKKPEELEEVIVFKMPTIKWSKDKAYEQGKAEDLAIEKAAKNPKPIGVYDGTLVNSPDLLRIGGMIISLFIKEKEISKPVAKIEFKNLVNSTLENDFFKKTLALKPEEVELFLEYCDADPNSKHVLDNPNPLKIMDFLMAKVVEFKKLPKN